MHDQNSQGHSEKYSYGCFAAKKSGLLVFALPMMTRQSHFSFDVGDRRRGTTRPEGHPQIAFKIFGPQITQAGTSLARVSRVPGNPSNLNRALGYILTSRGRCRNCDWKPVNFEIKNA